MENYKKCPLKKRPIVYEESGDNLQPENLSTKPEDLSLRKALIVQPRLNSSTKNFPLNLSSTSVYDQLTYMNPANWCVTPVKVRHSREGSVSPGSDCSNTSSEFNRETSISPPAPSECKNIHLRGLTYPQAVRVENTLRKERYVPYYNYRKEHTPQPVLDLTNQWPDTIYPSSQPQDLSIKSYIPEPALYHPFSKTNREDKTKTVSRYKCNDCGKSYSTFAGLSKHQQFHCPAAECNQVKKVFSCKSCDKVYTSLGALKMHIRTHTLPCKCTICGKAFSRPWLLQGHIRTHTGEKPFSCQYCHRAFADRSNLRAHLQTHSEVKKYSCTNVSCNKTFSRMSLLSKHIQGGCSASTAEMTARCI